MTGIIAHRGNNGDTCENTRGAFAQSLALDIAGVECDVNMTKDGHVVIIHDLTVDRTSNGTGAVAELELAQLRELNFGTEDSPEQIMLLDELLELVADHPGKRVLIETKHPSPFGARLDEAVADIVRARGMDDGEQVACISFNPEAIERFRTLLPRVPSFLLCDPSEKLPTDLRGATGLGPSISQAQRESMREPAYVWTVNEPREMDWCLTHGVELMATDLPQLAVDLSHGKEEA